jgi:3-hydroxybutyryl-CoA dehydrogenase
MKNVLVVGTADRLEEFSKLKIQNANVVFAFPDQVHAPDDMLSQALQGYGEEDYFEEDFEDEDDELSFHEGSDGDDEQDDQEIINAEEFDIVFDLTMDLEASHFVTYILNDDQLVIGGSALQPLAAGLGPWGEAIRCTFIGMNSLPTFINRPKLELSLLNASDKLKLDAAMQTLGLEYEIVADTLGLVSARVVAMIINEAAFVLGEGTADVEAVDNAMKLGTNYPLGPFEWCDKIGVGAVVTLLDGIHAEYGDGRYKVAPLLKRQADLGRSFYPAPLS